MGNWRTVNLRGALAAEDIAAAEEFLTPNEQWSNFGPLSYTAGLAGLGRWAQQVINADGNLSERDYDTESVADFLRKMVKVAPSLELKVHCGADWEHKKCIATVTVSAGEVTIGEPEVAFVAPVNEDAAMGRLFRSLLK